jgi:DNA-binding NarL/FixJ family response regulator
MLRGSSVIRVLIVDDHELIRLGLESVLGMQPDLELCGKAADGAAGLAMALSTAPDVVVMDVTMPCMDGVAATRAIVRDCPGARVLVLSGSADTTAVAQALAAGATAYLVKETDWTDVVAAIRSVHHGERPANCVAFNSCAAK